MHMKASFLFLKGDEKDKEYIEKFAITHKNQLQSANSKQKLKIE